nr:S4 domain-containing protein [Thermovibrio guaymasensis]
MVKRRSLAKEMCDKGMVKVNGKSVKASREISVGDEVEIDTLTRYFKFKVVEIPQGKNVSKKKAKELIQVLEDRKKDIREIIDLI